MNETKCPYCQGELEIGSLQGEGRKLRWHKTEELSTINKFLNVGGEQMGSNETISRMKGYCCKACKKLILNYE